MRKRRVLRLICRQWQFANSDWTRAVCRVYCDPLSGRHWHWLGAIGNSLLASALHWHTTPIQFEVAALSSLLNRHHSTAALNTLKTSLNEWMNTCDRNNRWWRGSEMPSAITNEQKQANVPVLNTVPLGDSVVLSLFGCLLIGLSKQEHTQQKQFLNGQTIILYGRLFSTLIWRLIERVSNWTFLSGHFLCHQ